MMTAGVKYCRLVLSGTVGKFKSRTVSHLVIMGSQHLGQCLVLTYLKHSIHLYIHYFEIMYLGGKSQKDERPEGWLAYLWAFQHFHLSPSTPSITVLPWYFYLACPKFFFQDSFEIPHLKSQLRKESKQYCFSTLGLFFFFFKETIFRDLPGGSVAENLPLQCRICQFDPGQGTKIPCAVQLESLLLHKHPAWHNEELTAEVNIKKL